MTHSLDSATIEALRSRGVDLTKPRRTIHYFYARDREHALALAGRLARDGRDIDVHKSGRDWAVVVACVLVVDAPTMAQIKRDFEAAASATHADYDGWEAAVDSVSD